jgi:hypothetical protein
MALNVLDIDMTKLYDAAREIVNLYRQQLELQNINASGELSNSADFDVDFNEDEIVVYFIYNSYGYYVEHGRKPTGGGSGQPWNNSIDDIIKWMQDKGIVPHGRSARPIPKRQNVVPHRKPRPPQDKSKYTREQLSAAYAIVTKIHNEGWYDPNAEGKEPLRKALEEAKANGIINRMYDIVAQAFDKEIELEIKKI